MPTLKDVARLARVDTSTVSRVLSGDPKQAAKGETRERILAAAKELGYRPNQVARSLRSQSTSTIGLIAPRLSDFAFTNIFDGIESAALEAEQGLLVVGWDFMGKNLASKREVLLHLLNDNIVDGVLIAFATIGDEFAPVLLSSRVPIVMVNRKAQLIGGSVTVQDTEAVKLAVNHLTSLGHSRIGYIGLEPGTTTASDRLEGFYSEMETMGLEVREEWMAVSASRDSDSQTTPLSAIIESSKLIGTPTALVVASVRPALLVISEMSERGIKVPLEMSVIAIGDNKFARITTPKLTTVWLPFEEMGRKSVEMLIDAVGGKELADVKLSDPPKIIQRDSTGAPRL